MSTMLVSLASSSLTLTAVAIVAKVTLLIAVGGIATLGLRGASAAVRHLVWSLTLAGAVALVLFVPVVPDINVRVPVTRQLSEQIAQSRSSDVAPARNALPPRSTSSATRSADAPPVEARAIGGSTATTASSMPGSDRSVGSIMFNVWLLGCAAVLLWSLLGHVALARLAGTSTTLQDAEWHFHLETARRNLGLTRGVSLLESASVRTPVTWGVIRPAILLPAGASAWTSDRKRVVILHELAHVARVDYLSQLLGTLACALFWFHPAIWVAARRLRVEAERACDDHVLHAGLPGIDYATHLLDVARRMKAMRLIGPAAVGMARPSHLEERLLAVLSATPSRRPIRSGTARAATLAMLAIVVPIAGIRPSMASSTPAPQAIPEPAVATSRKQDSTPPVLRPDTMTVPRLAPVTTITSGVLDIGALPRNATTRSSTFRAGSADTQQEFDFQDSVAATPDGDLDLDLRTGAGLTIVGWDRPWVRVRGTLAGPDAYRTRVSLSSRSRGALLRTSLSPGDGNSSTSHKFEIMVPRRYNLHLNSAGGGLSMKDVEGRFRGSTGGGEMTLDHLAGSASLSTGGGDIRVTDSDLSGTVSTGGGSIVLSAVKGGLRGSSGSGPVVYSEDDEGNAERLGDLTINGERIAGSAGSGSGSGGGSASGTGAGRGRGGAVAGGGASSVGRGRNSRSKNSSDWDGDFGADFPAPRLQITKAGGDIDLGEAPEGVYVSTGGGDVNVGRSSGIVDAHTGGGDIELGPVAGSARAVTGAGNVRITIVNEEGKVHDVDVSSGRGSVTLILPADFDARLELETAYTNNQRKKTRIISDFKLDQDESTEWSDDYGTPRKFVTGTATFGKGTGLIRVHIVNGDITVRRGK